MYVFIILVEWPPIGKIAAHSAYDMFSWYKYLIMPPTLKKLEGLIALGLSVCLWVGGWVGGCVC